MFKKNLTAGIIALSTLSATSVFAEQQNSIRFKGEISSQTCDVTVNDAINEAPVILMKSAKLRDLVKPGDTSTPVNFKMKLTGCTDPQTAQDVKIRFASSNVDATGNLKNIATADPATNISIQLLDPESKVINLTSGEATAKAFTLKPGNTSGEAEFTAQYIATGTPTSGKIEASVQYAITYL